MIDPGFWKNRKVFITGHTGFKGSWLCLWLHRLGAEVTGYSLKPPRDPNLFALCRIDATVKSVISDVRNASSLLDAVKSAKPEIVIHMAAQPLVLDSYKYPALTYETNVMGTINVLEAARSCKSVKAVINVTTDKCYENRDWVWGYREDEALGGYDPYSSSKACSELVTKAYRCSFFNPDDYSDHGVAIASARAGNVIGGGDWSAGRLIPDCVTSLLNGDKIRLRNPHAVRPWQHVLEPLSGYLYLAEKLVLYGPGYGEGWNFGPDDQGAKPVEWVVKTICEKWGENAGYETDSCEHPHEASYLKLDCSKAKAMLGWRPKWDLEKSIQSIVDWTRAYRENKDVRDACLEQIEEYTCKT